MSINNQNELDFFNNNQMKPKFNEKFLESIDSMRLLTWNKYLLGIANNPQMTKKEVCDHLGLKVGTINSIQKHYKLQSPFYFNKPKRRQNKEKNDKDEPPKEKTKKSTKKPKQKIIKDENYDYNDTFDKSLNSLKI
jgi:hypothetical protein